MRPAPVPCLPARQVFGGGDEQRAFDDRTQHKLGQHFDQLGRQQALLDSLLEPAGDQREPMLCLDFAPGCPAEYRGRVGQRDPPYFGATTGVQERRRATTMLRTEPRHSRAAASQVAQAS
jgi:hypothetical protein